MSILYDLTIKPRLQAANWFAYRLKSAIEELPARPAFKTLAESEIEDAEFEVVKLLVLIRDVKEQYAGKALEGTE